MSKKTAVIALHLEVVTDLTTEAFLVALKRFTSRRGVFTEIHSDNGSNFMGASRELKILYKNFFDKKDVVEATSHFCTCQGIQWKFIPSRAPNFGGL